MKNKGLSVKFSLSILLYGRAMKTSIYYINIIPKSTQTRTENKKFEVSDFTIKLYSFFLLNYNKLYILNAENKRVERLSAEHNI